jgi:hypothetical protein
LLQNRKNDGAADATERRSHKERRNPCEMKCVAANERDSYRAERVAEYGEKQASGEMADNFADLEFEAAFEKDKNQRERTKALRGASKNFGIDPVEQAAEQREEEIQGHRDIRRARSGEIVAEMRNRSK